tara:strand:- start:3654 stop:4949 length:1296 start_codon:yes stop_codon:yes gene_type:complete
MKLFKSLLVAPAALGLLAPLAATATEVNLNDVSNYSQGVMDVNSKSFEPLSNKNPLFISGGEGLSTGSSSDFSDDSFNSTTTLDGKAVFFTGAIDGADEIGGTETTQVGYVYQMNLNTSFTGDDNLYVRLKTGNGWSNWESKPGTYHIESSEDGSGVAVDKIWYTLPLGEKVTFTFGPKIENYYMLAATPSVYKPGVLKAFKLGGHGAAFGASTSTGVGLKYEFDNGFATSVTANSKGAEGTNGFLTTEDESKVNVMVAYTKDNYHVSGTFTTQNGSWDAWEYFATQDMRINEVTHPGVEAYGYALRAWFRPDETGGAIPSISVGYDTIGFEAQNHAIAKTGNGYSVALNWQDIVQPDDRIGLAFGQPMKVTSVVHGVSRAEVDPFIWEAYYSFRPNDSIEVTPGIFGGTDVLADDQDDLFGFALTSTFKF